MFFFLIHLKYLPLFAWQPLCCRVYTNGLYCREVFITPFHWVEATRMEGLLADSPPLVLYLAGTEDLREVPNTVSSTKSAHNIGCL